MPKAFKNKNGQTFYTNNQNLNNIQDESAQEHEYPRRKKNSKNENTAPKNQKKSKKQQYSNIWHSNEILADNFRFEFTKKLVLKIRLNVNRVQRSNFGVFD